MTPVALEVRGLSKRYRLGARGRQHDTLRDQLAAAARAVVRRRPRGASGDGTFWALRDLSFEVGRGEVLGIIGRNGAGKSTLLKILSRITEPTAGSARIEGRVGSLLEVGTGFHGELTGRENILLNGAILGMRKAEIERKFDQIVEFAGVADFIDTPVKRYSSGMYVRLAFAVAAHLETDILFMDEVLAVGDAAFQKKCLGKMDEVAREGRTILFVSHNMAAVENLCTRAMLMEGGRAVREGDTHAVIQHYLETVLPAMNESASLAERTDRTGTGTMRLTACALETADGTRVAAVRSGMDVVISLGFACRDGARPRNVIVGVSIATVGGQNLIVLDSGQLGQTFHSVPTSGTFRCRIPRFPLTAGTYALNAWLWSGGEVIDNPRNAVSYLQVEAGDFYGTGHPGPHVPFLVAGSWSLGDHEPAPPTQR